MTRYWKIVGWISFVVTVLVSVFIFLSDGSSQRPDSSKRPQSSRFITQ